MFLISSYFKHNSVTNDGYTLSQIRKEREPKGKEQGSKFERERGMLYV